MMSMYIRRGVPEDTDALVRLYNELGAYLANHINYPGWIRGVYPVRETASAGIQENALWMIQDGGRIAGSVILRNTAEPACQVVEWKVCLDDKEILVVYTFAVHPDYHGTGVGKKLMTFLLAYARLRNLKAVRLDVYEKNTPAIGLYTGFGFQYIGTVDLGYGRYGLNNFHLCQKLL